MEDDNVVFGVITARVLDADGNVVSENVIKNLITDVGDLYQSTRIAAGINSNGVSQPALVTGMKLGSSTTAAAKNGTGAALVTYITASNRAFDATYPQVASIGAGAGVNVTYRCTWPTGTAWTINEAVIVTDSATDATSAAAATIARGVFGSPIAKATTEALEITWNHRQQGA